MSVAAEASTSTFSTIQWSPLCHHFEFDEIVSATKNFNEALVIGRGGFGKVYKGIFGNESTPVVAAIKRLDSMSNQGESEFWAEVETLSKLRHNHLVSLIGYCNHQREMILVYEYMPRGTLEDHLHKLGTRLSWCARLKICIGAACGLDYLHTGTGIDFGIIHRDVKSSNILLDKSWAAKVSDFGLSKTIPRNQQTTHVSTNVKGTFGYIDPNYYTTGKLTRKSDVYAFGVVLLEVLCRKRAVEDSFELGMATWALDSIKAGRLKNIVDYDIRHEISSKCLKQFARIAERCLDEHPKHRPTMAEVVLRLKEVLNLQEETNNMSQITIFQRFINMFSFTGHGQSLGIISHASGSTGLNLVHRFTLADIKCATNNFNEVRLIGEVGFGKVYMGVADGGKTKLAIKRLKQNTNQGLREFFAEIIVLSKLQHQNLISLKGYCEENMEMIIVYDYMANGSLYDHLYKTQKQQLAWTERLKICIGAARGLHYLHDNNVIHRDVKTSSILLDDEWVAKLTAFGLSERGPLGDQTHVSTMVKGTLGYMDPQYYRNNMLTKKSDVYAFGVVLFEVLCARPVVDQCLPEEEMYLVEWAPHCYRGGNLDKIVDPYLRGKYSPESFKKVAETAVKCVADRREDRPSMEDVVSALKYALALQEKPPKGKSQEYSDENLMASTSNTKICDFNLATENSNDYDINDGSSGLLDMLYL